MKDILELKEFTGSVKDIDMKSKRITGYLSSFGNKDHDGDIIVKGAFNKSITERKDDIYFLNQHNWAQPHGKMAVLQEDSKGLYFESNPLIDTSYSIDTLKLYEAGIIKEHSIGFVTVKSDYDKKSDARMLKEIKLFEGSNVTMGANSNTPFTGFKSLTIKDINERSKVLYKAIRNGTFTDDTFVLLEYALKDLQLQAFNLGKQSLDNQEPSNHTQKSNEPIIIDTLNNFINNL